MLYSWSQTFFHVFVAPVFLFLRTGVNLFCVCVYRKTALSISDVLTLHACVKIHTLSFWSLSPTQPPVSPQLKDDTGSPLYIDKTVN